MADAMSRLYGGRTSKGNKNKKKKTAKKDYSKDDKMSATMG